MVFHSFFLNFIIFFYLQLNLWRNSSHYYAGIEMRLVSWIPWTWKHKLFMRSIVLLTDIKWPEVSHHGNQFSEIDYQQKK